MFYFHILQLCFDKCFCQSGRRYRGMVLCITCLILSIPSSLFFRLKISVLWNEIYIFQIIASHQSSQVQSQFSFKFYQRSLQCRVRMAPKWVHCNVCRRGRGQLRTRLNLTNCGYMFCTSCSLAADRRWCPDCLGRCRRTLMLTSQAPDEVKALFEGVAVKIKK